MQKALKQIISEIWSQVIPQSCPHCQGKSPGFRKDGNTKIFQRPLSEKAKNAMLQQERISTKARSTRNLSQDETNLENTTVASSRKLSGTAASQEGFVIGGDSSGRSDIDEVEEEEEDEDMEEEIASGQQKMLTAQEVKDHIERLWAKEKNLLDLIYGRYHPIVDGEPYVSDSLGPKMFFMNKLIVPPNRFRPES